MLLIASRMTACVERPTKVVTITTLPERKLPERFQRGIPSILSKVIHKVTEHS